MTRTNWKQVLSTLFNLEDGRASNEAVQETILSGVNLQGTNMFILMLAILIGCIGLNMNNVSAIIGVMLLSPIMGGIMGIGFGFATNDMPLAKKSAKTLAIQVAIALVVSMVYFKLTPISVARSELLARTTPTIWDVLIAFFGGMAGMIGATRKERSNVIPGVAIATALLPPLCTVGYGLAMGDSKFYGGAFYLFFINGFFICLSTYLVACLMKFPRKTYIDEFGNEQTVKVGTWTGLIAIITIIPSFIFAYQLVGDSVFDSNVSKYVEQEFKFDQTRVVSRYVNKQTQVLEVALLGDRVSDDAIELLENKLADYNLGSMTLKITQGELAQSLGSDDVKSIIQQELYEKNQIALTDKEAQIEVLENELFKYKLSEYDTSLYFKELQSLYPSLLSFSLSQAKETTTTTSDQELIVLARATFDVPMTQADYDRILGWLKVKTNQENVQLWMEVQSTSLEAEVDSELAKQAE